MTPVRQLIEPIDDSSRGSDHFGTESTLGLEQQLHRSQRQVRELLAHIDVLTRQKQHVDQILSGVLQSKSWRITAPIRAITELLRSIRPIYRSRRVQFDRIPGPGIHIDGDRVTITGPSPSIQLQPRNGSRVPTGLVFIKGRTTAKKYPVFSLLYYRTGEGFDGTQRLWVPLSQEKHERTLAFLPLTTKELRLDPFDTSLAFDLHDFEVREIGKVQCALHVLWKNVRSGLFSPRVLIRRFSKLRAIFREGGFTAIKARLFAFDHFTHNYQEWVKKYDTFENSDRVKMKDHLTTLSYQPLISIVMPTYNTPERWLRAAIESVLRQIYQNWELCIADDCSSDPSVRSVLEEYARKDSRIKVTFRKENGHISHASNSAAELATGEFVGLLDHDDELTEHALYMVVAELNRYADADLIYSDEDKMTSYGMRFNPYFKSDWNPDLLCSQNYVCHFTVVRMKVFRTVGGFRAGFEGAQDWDLILRVADASEPSRIRHIPHVLYHWRVIESSTAHSTSAKPYVLTAQQRAVSEHLERRGIKGAQVMIMEAISQLRVKLPISEPAPLVSLIIPTKDQVDLLRRCVSGILDGTDYKNLELIIVDNGSRESETISYLNRIARDARVTILRDQRPFNFSRLNNDAVKVAKGSLIGFLNNDLEIIEGDWLKELVSHAVRPEVGGVGARLLYPNGLLQHGGIIVGIGGVAGHNHKGRPRHDPGYFNRAILCQNLSGVTAACMVMRRDVFDAVGGFEEGALSVAFNDVDLCLKIRAAGYLIVYTPYAELFHHESASRGYETTPEKFQRFEGEVETMKRRWGAVLNNDPYYNPNLTLLTEDFAFAFPPRVDREWTRPTVDRVVGA